MTSEAKPETKAKEVKSEMKLALDFVTTLAEKCEDDVKSKFRARARDLVSYVYFQGTTYTLAVAAARSSARAVEEGLNKNIDDIMKMCSDRDYAKKLGLSGAEEISYALYGAALLYILKSLGVIPKQEAQKEGDALKGVLEYLLTSPNRARYIDLIASKVAEWLKAFAEAYIIKVRG